MGKPLGASGPAAGGRAAEAAGGPERGVSTVEVFGFVGWITSSVAYVLYILWAYTPEAVLQAHGVHYYPSKYWAVALPAWACVTVVFVFWLYQSLCMMAAPDAGDASSLVDWATKRKEDAGMPSYFSLPHGRGGGSRSADAGGGSGAGQQRGRGSGGPRHGSIPPLVDIPHEIVSAVLHGGLSPQEAEEQYDRSRRRRR